MKKSEARLNFFNASPNAKHSLGNLVDRLVTMFFSDHGYFLTDKYQYFLKHLYHMNTYLALADQGKVSNYQSNS